VVSLSVFSRLGDNWSQKGSFQFLAKHLKRVKIIDFVNSLRSKYLLALIKFLLGDALVLEKIIIKADLHAQHGPERHEAAYLFKLLRVSQRVLSYLKSFPKC